MVRFFTFRKSVRLSVLLSNFFAFEELRFLSFLFSCQCSAPSARDSFIMIAHRKKPVNNFSQVFSYFFCHHFSPRGNYILTHSRHKCNRKKNNLHYFKFIGKTCKISAIYMRVYYNMRANIISINIKRDRSFPQSLFQFGCIVKSGCRCRHIPSRRCCRCYIRSNRFPMQRARTFCLQALRCPCRNRRTNNCLLS